MIIKLDIAYPVHPVVKQYVDYYYILNPYKERLDNFYTAYPNTNQPVIFFEDTDVIINANHHHLKFNKNAAYFCGILNRFIEPVHVTLTGNIRTINIIFKSIGVNAFIKDPYAHVVNGIFQNFNCWNTNASLISELFSLSNQQLVKRLDEILLNNYTSFVNQHLLNAIDLMSCEDATCEIKNIEHLLGLSRKNLFRLFKTHTGISPTSFRRIARFRQALEKNKSQCLTLTQLAYKANFADQSHFIKELHKLTGDKPSSFIKGATYVNGSKLLIKQRGI